MPEGHVIHHIARHHHGRLAGKRLRVSSPQGRFARESRQLDRTILRSVDAHGKHLFYHWQGGRILHIHLGLYGRFHDRAVPPPQPQGEVRLRVIGRQFAFDLNGPNRCELISEPAWRKLRQRLGPDPLRSDADPQRAWAGIRRSRAAIGSLLLNQAIVAGAGNIYRADVLFATGIHPNRSGNSLTESDFDEIWSTLVRFMKLGLRYRRIVNADPAVIGRPRSRMTRDEALLIYKKERCPRCNGRVSAWKLAGRSMYACVQCQKA